MRQVVLWSIVSLSTSSFTTLGTCMSNKVGRFLVGRSTVTVRNLLSSFSRISRSVLLLHSTSTALFAMFFLVCSPPVLMPLGQRLPLLVFWPRGKMCLGQTP